MESNFPMGKVWLKTCQKAELGRLMPVIAVDVLLLLGSTQKEGKLLWQRSKNEEFFTLALCSCPQVACPMHSGPGWSLLSLHQLLLCAEDVFLCLFHRRREMYCCWSEKLRLKREKGRDVAVLFQLLAGAALSPLDSAALEKGL